MYAIIVYKYNAMNVQNAMYAHLSDANKGYVITYVEKGARLSQCKSSQHGLPLSLRLLPRVLSDTFYSSLKTVLLTVQVSGVFLSSN